MNYAVLNDIDLVALLKADDHRAFTEIYQRYSSLLYQHIFRKTANEADADDILHDLFADVWDRRDTLEITGNVDAYLFTAVRNRVFKLFARKKVSDAYVNSIAHFAATGACLTDHKIREHQLLVLIEREIARLPPRMREVFELSRKEQLSHKEIADRLGIADETVKKHIHHALRILRVKLGILIFIFYWYQR